MFANYAVRLCSTKQCGYIATKLATQRGKIAATSHSEGCMTFPVYEPGKRITSVLGVSRFAFLSGAGMTAMFPTHMVRAS